MGSPDRYVDQNQLKNHGLVVFIGAYSCPFVVKTSGLC